MYSCMCCALINIYSSYIFDEIKDNEHFLFNRGSDWTDFVLNFAQVLQGVAMQIKSNIPSKCSDLFYPLVF